MEQGKESQGSRVHPDATGDLDLCCARSAASHLRGVESFGDEDVKEQPPSRYPLLCPQALYMPSASISLNSFSSSSSPTECSSSSSADLVDASAAASFVSGAAGCEGAVGSAGASVEGNGSSADAVAGGVGAAAGAAGAGAGAAGRIESSPRKSRRRPSSTAYSKSSIVCRKGRRRHQHATAELTLRPLEMMGKHSPRRTIISTRAYDRSAGRYSPTADLACYMD